MSMVCLAVRLCLTEALLGKTMAGQNVYDSNVEPLENFVKSSALLITVATDEQSATYAGMPYATANRELAVVVEMAIAKKVKIAVKVGEPEEDEVGIPQTDDGLEMSLDVMGREIMRVMQADTGEWAEMFRIFAGKPTKSTSKRGAGADKGIRFAARQMIITYDPLDEPPFGEAPPEIWGRLITALRAGSDELVRIGDLIEKAITGTAIPDWARLQADLGLSTDAMAGVGLGPLLSGEEPADAEALETDGDHLATVAVPEEEP